MAIELGTAYVTVAASTGGLGESIRKEFGGLDAPVQKSTTSLWGKVSNGLTTTLKVGAVAAGAAVAAGIGASLVKGFSRLDTIDQAQAKLAGLGHSAATVGAVMDNALGAVRGTAFGMGEAATAAAGAMAAGIQPGVELERNLKLVADAATIAGTDMGSMGAIFNKVAASNKVQMDVINQLHDAGVPALSLLADQMGVTAEEASKMASAGQIDFATFQAAIESGMGGAALQSGTTFSGAMDNVGAALGRLGAAFLGPAFTQAPVFLTAITDSLDKLAPFAGVAGGAVGAFLSDLGGGFAAMATAFQTGEAQITSSGVASVLEGFGVAARTVFDAFAPVFAELGTVFSELGPQVLDLVSNFSPMSLIFQALTPILPMIASLFGTIGTTLATIIPPIVEIATTLAGALVPIITQLVTAVMPPLMQVFQAVAPIIGSLVEAIAPVIAIILGALMPVINALMPVVQTVFSVIANVVTAALGIVQGIITVVTGIISGDWGMVWDGIKQVFSGIWDTICAVVEGAINIVMSVITGVIDAISSTWSNVWNGISAFFSTVWNAIVSAASGFVASVTKTFNDVMTFIQDIPGKVMEFFTGIGDWLKDSGKALIDGFLSGITNAFEGAKNFVADGLEGIRNLFPFSPAKEGPFSGRGWVAYSGLSVGETFTQSLVQGINSGKGAVVSALAGVQSEFGAVSAGGVALSASIAGGVASAGSDDARALRLQVGGREFDAYLGEVADGRVQAGSVVGGRAVSAGSDRRF